LPELNSFIADSGETNNGCDLQDSDDEYNADQTIIGGKSVDWIVNGIFALEKGSHNTSYRRTL